MTSHRCTRPHGQHLAALAIEHGATLMSFDGDFSRFAGLRFKHLL